MSGSISSSEQDNYLMEQHHEQYLYKEGYTIANELGYTGSEDNFQEDFACMIAERNLRLRHKK